MFLCFIFIVCLCYVYMSICSFIYIFVHVYVFIFHVHQSIFSASKESSIFPIPFSLGPFQYCFCFSDSPEMYKGIMIVLFLILMCQTGQGCFSVSDRHILWLFILLRFQFDSLLVSYGCLFIFLCMFLYSVVLSCSCICIPFCKYIFCLYMFCVSIYVVINNYSILCLSSIYVYFLSGLGVGLGVGVAYLWRSRKLNCNLRILRSLYSIQ